MNISKEIKIPVQNHKLHFETEAFSAYDAYLRVKDCANSPISAIKSEDYLSITLRFAKIECPLCLSKHPMAAFAYIPGENPEDSNDQEHKNSDDNEDTAGEKRTKLINEFYNWAMQISIPEIIDTREFSFIKFCENDSMMCSHCGHTEALTEGDTNGYRLSIDSNNSRTSITQKIKREDARKLLPYGIYEPTGASIPREINLIFDHDTGKTFFEEKSGGATQKNDITEKTNPLNGFKLRKFISDSMDLKKLLILIFEELCNGNMPFYDIEITLETLIILNRFKGFPTRFYNAIPFRHGTRSLDSSFIVIADLLSNYQNIDLIYKQLGLPQKKSFRKVIFERPELLFYAHEIRKLFCLNYDVLVDMLSSRFIYGLLAHLRIKPELFIFLNQMIKETGSVSTWNYLKKCPENFVFDATDYLRVTDGRSGVYPIKRWRKNLKSERNASGIGFNVSAPQESEIPDEQIESYYFVKLKNSDEYEKAAVELKNCLRGFWRFSFGGVVFCIKTGSKYDSKYVAAIEVDKKKVIEAGLSGNEPINNNKEVYAVFMSWVKKHGLKHDFEELPF